MNTNSFGARGELHAGAQSLSIFRLDAAGDGVAGLPYSMKVLLENLLRHEDGETVTAEDIESLARWDGRPSEREISFKPARVLMQDFTGVPAVVDLAAMRDAIEALGGDPATVNPMIPVDLVIDHSVIVDLFAGPRRLAGNVELEYQRNGERYTFLRWAQQAFAGFRVVPPGTGDLSPGEPRVPRPRRVRRRAQQLGLSRHARRHRHPHADGQRARRARLGCWRDRGGGGDARPADLDARARRGRHASCPARCRRARPQRTWCSP